MISLPRPFAVWLASIALVPFCEAALYYSEVRNLPIPADADGVYFNPVTGSVSTSPPANLSTVPWLNLFFGGTGIGSSVYLEPVITAAPTGNGDGVVMKVVSMEEIGQALHFAAGGNGSENHTGNGVRQFAPGTPGFVGFAFRTSAGGPVSYGWMSITVNDVGPGMIHSWAYETSPGVAIAAGAVPECGTSGWIMLAGVLMFSSRRRPAARPLCDKSE